MSEESVNTRTRSSWSRAAILVGTFGCALALSTTAASAEGTWTVKGSSHITRAEAQADFSDLKLKCRRQGGFVVETGILTRSFDPGPGAISRTDPDSPYRAYVVCRSLR
ncbi:hypothetical protein [Amycolatopsis sp. NPDC059657]|uniref:hypothetical protein n=1 Tax=Amycolatopsis sp. NPDC059657 TaxID=3346899 RepID=UPI00366C1851